MNAPQGLLFPGPHARRNPQKPAVVMADSGTVLTYGELDAFANRLGRLFQALALKTGDHVACCIENRVECVAIQWGAHYAGLYYTFLSTRLTEKESAYILEDCEARVVIVSAATVAATHAAVKSMARPPRIYSLDAVPGTDSLDTALSAFDGNPIQGTLEGSEMLYSSGTTGRPKGVQPALTGKPLGSTAILAGLMKKGFGVGDDSVYFSAMPYYHAAPMKWAQGITVLGGDGRGAREIRGHGLFGGHPALLCDA